MSQLEQATSSRKFKLLLPQWYGDGDSLSLDETLQLLKQSPELVETCRVASVLLRIDRWDALSDFLEQGVSDLWFPFPKQTLRHLLKDPVAEKEFLRLQEEYVLVDGFFEDGEDSGFHKILEDGEDFVQSDRILGEGGFAIVDQVKLPTTPPLVCVRKKIGRPKQFKTQKQILDAFTREIKIMSQVDNQHCVKFLGSYTDHDTLAIFSLPVADMDLATYLNLEKLSADQLNVIRHGIGCLCIALHYLHENKIRHEDLKPQNVLIHGKKVLLTDFGFSFDFSTDSVSTTTGRPSHWTARYSAPEIMDHQPRNRATDIWGLGCILVEMLSRLYGHRLSEVIAFWKRTGNEHPSFSLNTEATTKWIDWLHEEVKSDSQVLALFCTVQNMLETSRRLRPTAQQVVAKLSDLDFLFPDHSSFLADCCREAARPKGSVLSLKALQDGPAAFFYPLFNDYTCIFADIDLWTFGAESYPLSHYFQDFRQLKSICTNLIYLTSKDSAFPHSRFDYQQLIRSREDWIEQAMLSLNTYSTSELRFRRLRCDLMLPTLYSARLAPQDRLVQVSLVPICFPRSELYGRYFFMVTFKTNENVMYEYERRYDHWSCVMAQDSTPYAPHDTGNYNFPSESRSTSSLITDGKKADPLPIEEVENAGLQPHHLFPDLLIRSPASLHL